MKEILIFSDTHGDINRCITIIERFPKVDAIIHAGDCVRDAEDLQSIYPNIPIYYVQGNNDFFTNAPGQLTFIIDGIRFFLTHGHEYHVKYESRYSTLSEKAQSMNADLCVFGHTHIPYTSYEGKMTLLNPGSIRFGATYAVAEIENGKLRTSILEEQ